MPSWNIHTAHAERLLQEEGAARLGIRDVDAFLLGNLAPDIHLGYMVPEGLLSRKLEYRDTHFAEPGFVPEPAYWGFFERYGAAGVGGPAHDVVLGCWAHLVADHTYNVRSNNFLYQNHIEPGEATRIRKQGDFDTFGCTLAVSMVPRATSSALAQCEAFPQYAICEQDARGACDSMASIVASDAARRAKGLPAYVMLNAGFLGGAFEAAHAIMVDGLLACAAGDPAWGARHE